MPHESLQYFLGAAYMPLPFLCIFILINSSDWLDLAKDLSSLHSCFKQIFTDLSDICFSRKIDSENNCHLGNVSGTEVRAAQGTEGQYASGDSCLREKEDISKRRKQQNSPAVHSERSLLCRLKGRPIKHPKGNVGFTRRIKQKGDLEK